MNNLSLSDWSNVAQVITTVVTFSGILVSIWLSTTALREVQMDRKLRSKPHLAFEGGGWSIPIEFVNIGYKVPGLNPEHLKKVFGNSPKDSKSVRIKYDVTNGNFGFGKLRNHGEGPALGVHICWNPNELWIGSEHFIIDGSKRDEPVYHKDLNTWPAIPRNIQPSEESSINSIPTFITKDFDRKITRVNGILEIQCRDIYENTHTVLQEFYIFTNYQDINPSVHVTFSDVLS